MCYELCLFILADFTRTSTLVLLEQYLWIIKQYYKDGDLNNESAFSAGVEQVRVLSEQSCDLDSAQHAAHLLTRERSGRPRCWWLWLNWVSHRMRSKYHVQFVLWATKAFWAITNLYSRGQKPICNLCSYAMILLGHNNNNNKSNTRYSCNHLTECRQPNLNAVCDVVILKKKNATTEHHQVGVNCNQKQFFDGFLSFLKSCNYE